MVSTVSHLSQWDAVTFLPSDTATPKRTVGPTPFSHPAPVAVASTDKGHVYLARGRTGKAASTRQLVLMSLDTSTGKPKELELKLTLKPDHHTVSMAAVPNSDNLYLAAVDATTKNISMIKVDGAAKAPVVLDGSSSTTATQIAVSKDGTVHGVYDRRDQKNRAFLNYFTCK